MSIQLTFIALFFYGCGSASAPEKPATDTIAPYPTIEQQRAALANKGTVPYAPLLDSVQLLHDLEFLSSAKCEGRAPGSAGHELARQYILTRMRSIGLDSIDNSLAMNFPGKAINESKEVQDVVGRIKGTGRTQDYIVMTAHYDHLGIRNGSTYFGADDNASGVACLLAMAAYFKKHPLAFSILFAAVDREETGMEGSFMLVDKLTDASSGINVRFNLNMDMVARSDRDELFVSGVRQTPAFATLVNMVQPKTNVKLIMGHDGVYKEDDWTTQSDHLPFARKKIPFLYFGVEDHPDYHHPTDTFDKVNPRRYVDNCNLVAMIAMGVKL